MSYLSALTTSVAFLSVLLGQPALSRADVCFPDGTCATENNHNVDAATFAAASDYLDALYHAILAYNDSVSPGWTEQYGSHVVETRDAVGNVISIGCDNGVVSYTTGYGAAPARVDTNTNIAPIGQNQDPVFNQNLKVLPSLVRPGEVTHVFWDVNNVSSCTVSGDNGDTWTGLMSPLYGATSSPITVTTTYVLSCITYPGREPVNQHAKVQIVPYYEEQ